MARLAKALVIIFLPALVLAGRAGAAGNTQPTGITLTPAYQQVTIAQDQSSQPVSFTVTNNEARQVTLKLSSADFNTLNDTGGVLFAGTNPIKLQTKYGLAKWLSLPADQITVPAGQTLPINASILNIESMPAGGHYGAVLLEIQNQSADKSGNGVALHPVASSLLFVTKQGGDTHKLSLSSVNFSHNLFKLPSSVTLKFSNTGNTHLVPRGSVYLKSPGGKLISKGIINENSGIVLPETSRKFTVPLQKVSSANSVGSYKLFVDFRFDGIDQYRGYRTSLTFVPLFVIAGLILGLVVFGYLGYWMYGNYKSYR